MNHLRFEDVSEMLKSIEYTNIKQTGENQFTATNVNGITHGFTITKQTAGEYAYFIHPDYATMEQFHNTEKEHAQQVWCEFVSDTNDKIGFTDFIVNGCFEFKTTKMTDPAINIQVPKIPF